MASTLGHFSPTKSSCQDHLSLSGPKQPLKIFSPPFTFLLLTHQVQRSHGQLLPLQHSLCSAFTNTCYRSTCHRLLFQEKWVKPRQENSHFPLPRSLGAVSMGLELHLRKFLWVWHCLSSEHSYTFRELPFSRMTYTDQCIIKRNKKPTMLIQGKTKNMNIMLQLHLGSTALTSEIALHVWVSGESERSVLFIAIWHRWNSSSGLEAAALVLNFLKVCHFIMQRKWWIEEWLLMLPCFRETATRNLNRSGRAHPAPNKHFLALISKCIYFAILDWKEKHGILLCDKMSFTNLLRKAKVAFLTSCSKCDRTDINVC